ncbi:MAG TPA: ATP-binding protein [Candidatus Binatia bacterium]|nr:ATP-binding protein [Candidatus Binatia bacterium]
MSLGLSDPSLASHLDRITAYARGAGLLDPGIDRPELRDALAAFIQQRAPALLEEWIRKAGPALEIPERDWPGICSDQEAALARWARHIANPANLETYLFLRSHTRRGFIAQFPASRFLAAQMRFVQLLTDDLRREYAGEPALAEQLSTLLVQEFRVRMLHITDFFVEGREELLLEQEASYRRAIDHAPAAILMAHAADGLVFVANQVAERLLGWQRTALEGRPLVDVHPPAERGRAEQLLRTALAQGHATRDDLHLMHRDGRRIPVITTAGFIEYGDRHWLQLMCVDISDRERLESQLIQSEKMAAIGQLAAGIAHELRNPLAIVMNALYDLRQVLGSDNAEITEDLHIAEEEITRAQAIIKNLLEFSRESGGEIERVDVNDLLSRTVQLMQKYLQNNGVRVTVDLGTVPTCVSNSNAMRQILLNLVTNAVQAMPQGGELTLRTERVDGDRVRLEVRDTGVGIPSASLTDIFNPFYTTKAPGQGTGLGLSVVHSILQRYRGEIRVASQVGVGTTFTIELPCPCHDESPGVG